MAMKVIGAITAVIASAALLVFAGRELPRRRARAAMRTAAERLREPAPSREYLLAVRSALDSAERWRLRDAGGAAEWEAWIAAFRGNAETVPALVSGSFDEAVVTLGKDRAATIAAEWQKMRDMSGLMGLSEVEHDRMLMSMNEQLSRFDLLAEIRRLEKEIPSALSAGNIGRTEKVARRCVEMLDEIDVADDQRLRGMLRGLIGRLAARTARYVAGRRDSAEGCYARRSVEEGDRLINELTGLAERAPVLVNLAHKEFDEGLMAARAARERYSLQDGVTRGGHNADYQEVQHER